MERRHGVAPPGDRPRPRSRPTELELPIARVGHDAAGAAIAGLGAELMGARGVFAVFAVASILLLVLILTVTDAGIEATRAESKRL